MNCTGTKICCIVGHRYGRALMSGLLGLSETKKGRLTIDHVFLLHPSNIWTTGGYSFPKDLLDQESLPYSYFQSVSDSHVVETLKSVAPDYVLVCGLRRILGPEVLEAVNATFVTEGASDFAARFIAFHPSDLPKGAGLSPIQWAIFGNDKCITVSAFYLGDYPVDGGPIVAKESIAFPSDGDARLADELVGTCIKRILANVVPRMVDRSLRATPQSNKGRTYRRQTGALDRWIRFDEPVRFALQKIRAFSSPYGGCFGELGGKIVQILDGGETSDFPSPLGTGEYRLIDQALVIRCFDGYLRVCNWRWADE